jgi:hypothetical protein
MQLINNQEIFNTLSSTIKEVNINDSKSDSKLLKQNENIVNLIKEVKILNDQVLKTILKKTKEDNIKKCNSCDEVLRLGKGCLKKECFSTEDFIKSSLTILKSNY